MMKYQIPLCASLLSLFFLASMTLADHLQADQEATKLLLLAQAGKNLQACKVFASWKTKRGSNDALSQREEVAGALLKQLIALHIQYVKPKAFVKGTDIYRHKGMASLVVFIEQLHQLYPSSFSLRVLSYAPKDIIRGLVRTWLLMLSWELQQTFSSLSMLPSFSGPQGGMPGLVHKLLRPLKKEKHKIWVLKEINIMTRQWLPYKHPLWISTLLGRCHEEVFCHWKGQTVGELLLGLYSCGFSQKDTQLLPQIFAQKAFPHTPLDKLQKSFIQVLRCNKEEVNAFMLEDKNDLKPKWMNVLRTSLQQEEDQKSHTSLQVEGPYSTTSSQYTPFSLPSSTPLKTSDHGKNLLDQTEITTTSSLSFKQEPDKEVDEESPLEWND